eukprot:TRINITY_DN67_c0_g1_i3.p1 TRINITY_DN67_c0_g1~~TRINITY_DN67_c0_g1_i3.p1  ORF type:complete len:707 (+),score=135.98 TRINITY_DN67_c0_g1_i3:369-2489(+)
MAFSFAPRPVIYLPLHPRRPETQFIYKAFQAFSDSLLACARKDGACDTFRQLSVDLRQAKELYTCAWVVWVLKLVALHDDWDWPSCLARTAFTIEIKAPCTAVDALAVLRQVPLQARPFFFLDEVTLEDSMHMFIGDVLRLCGVVPFLMGSDSGVANLVKSLDRCPSRTRGQPYDYCYLVASTPPSLLLVTFNGLSDILSYLGEKSSDLRRFIEHSAATCRPLFAMWALESLQQTLQRERRKDIGEQSVLQLLDAVASHVARRAIATKKFPEHMLGRSAQVCLFSPVAVQRYEDALRDNGLALKARVTALHEKRNARRRKRAAHALLAESPELKAEFAALHHNAGAAPAAIVLDFLVKMADSFVEEKAPFLARHFARLQLGTTKEGQQESCVLQYDGKCPVYSDSEHTPFCARSRFFPSVADEPLLHLSLPGTAVTSAFYGCDGSRCSARAAFYNAYHTATGSSMVPVNNPNAETHNGDYLEQLVAATSGAASHYRGLSGTTVNEFVGLLAVHLFPLSATSWLPGGDPYTPLPPISLAVPLHNYCAALKDKTVGYLAPPNHVWPDLLTALVPHIRLSTIQRTANKEMRDATIDDWLVVECKNWQQPLPLSEFQSVLRRVQPTTLLHVVVCQQLQDSYFTASHTKASFGDLAMQHPPLTTSLILQCSLDASTHELVFTHIKGTPKQPAGAVARVVLFFPVGDCEKLG